MPNKMILKLLTQAEKLEEAEMIKGISPIA